MKSDYLSKSEQQSSPLGVKRWLAAFFLINRLSIKSVLMRKSSWFASLVFAGSLLILFPFALGSSVLHRLDVRIGSLWSINEFVAAITISRMFYAEQEHYVMDYLLSSRMPRTSILFAKISFTALLIFSLQIPISFLWFIFYNISGDTFFAILPTLFFVSILFSLGSASLGALINCITTRSLAKEILQPMLFFPLQSALLLASVTLSLQAGTQDNLVGAFSASAWWTVLLVYPILFSALGFLLSSVLLQE